MQDEQTVEMVRLKLAGGFVGLDGKRLKNTGTYCQYFADRLRNGFSPTVADALEACAIADVFQAHDLGKIPFIQLPVATVGVLRDMVSGDQQLPNFLKVQLARAMDDAVVLNEEPVAAPENVGPMEGS